MRTLDVPIIRDFKNGENRSEFKSLPSRTATAYQEANQAARELMKRYIRGRNNNKDQQSLTNYEK